MSRTETINRKDDIYNVNNKKNMNSSKHGLRKYNNQAYERPFIKKSFNKIRKGRFFGGKLKNVRLKWLEYFLIEIIF